MNNYELAIKIEECLTEVNALDAIEKLIDLRKDYKESEFYKKTKMSFDQCVEMYGKMIQVKMSRRSLTDIVEGYLLNLNPYAVQRLIEKIGKQLEDVDLTVIDNFFSRIVDNLDFSALQSKIEEFEELNIKASKL